MRRKKTLNDDVGQKNLGPNNRYVDYVIFFFSERSGMCMDAGFSCYPQYYVPVITHDFRPTVPCNSVKKWLTVKPISCVSPYAVRPQ
jgi:hypothetical protein